MRVHRKEAWHGLPARVGTREEEAKGTQGAGAQSCSAPPLSLFSHGSDIRATAMVPCLGLCCTDRISVLPDFLYRNAPTGALILQFVIEDQPRMDRIAR